MAKVLYKKARHMSELIDITQRCPVCQRPFSEHEFGTPQYSDTLFKSAVTYFYGADYMCPVKGLSMQTFGRGMLREYALEGVNIDGLIETELIYQE